MTGTSRKAIILEKHHGLRDYLKPLIHEAGIVPFSFDSAATCLDNLNQLDPSFIVVGSHSLETTLKFINALQAVNCRLPVVMITDNEPVQRYIRLNGFDNMLMLNALENVSDVRAGIHWAVRCKIQPSKVEEHPVLIGASPALMDVRAAVPALSRSREALLIQGEAGTGRETLARTIHFQAVRDGEAAGPFMKIDAAALGRQPQLHLLQTFERAMMQFAKASRSGIKEQPQRRSLFVKNVDFLTPQRQNELLNLIEARLPAADSHFKKSCANVHVIAAGSSELNRKVAHHQFRRDLFHRISVLQVKMPPLRQRVEDIGLLTDFFTYKYCRLMNRSYFALSAKTKAVFARYPWPGNVAELESLVQRAVVGGNEKACVKHLYAADKELLNRRTHEWLHGIGISAEAMDGKTCARKLAHSSLKAICRDFLADVEKEVIKRALETTNWHRKKAAALLNISYKSVLNKIKEYQLD